MIQYTKNIPNKIDYFELLKTVNENVDVSELSSELDSTIACVSVYNGERLIGLGRVKKEGPYLCIEDLIVKLEEYEEEIKSNIIVYLFNQLNEMKNYDMTVRDCLNMKKSNEELMFTNQIENNESVSMNYIQQPTGFARA
ncbi:MAG: hypothetical protein IKE01_02715 [Clostridia bacterium]|nr:hypothetical protein [Clostridia bacterium]